MVSGPVISDDIRGNTSTRKPLRGAASRQKAALIMTHYGFEPHNDSQGGTVPVFWVQASSSTSPMIRCKRCTKKSLTCALSAAKYPKFGSPLIWSTCSQCRETKVKCSLADRPFPTADNPCDRQEADDIVAISNSRDVSRDASTFQSAASPSLSLSLPNPSPDSINTLHAVRPSGAEDAIIISAPGVAEGSTLQMQLGGFSLSYFSVPPTNPAPGHSHLPRQEKEGPSPNMASSSGNQREGVEHPMASLASGTRHIDSNLSLEDALVPDPDTVSDEQSRQRSMLFGGEPLRIVEPYRSDCSDVHDDFASAVTWI